MRVWISCLVGVGVGGWGIIRQRTNRQANGRQFCCINRQWLCRRHVVFLVFISLGFGFFSFLYLGLRVGILFFSRVINEIKKLRCVCVCVWKGTVVRSNCVCVCMRVHRNRKRVMYRMEVCRVKVSTGINSVPNPMTHFFISTRSPSSLNPAPPTPLNKKKYKSIQVFVINHM